MRLDEGIASGASIGQYVSVAWPETAQVVTWPDLASAVNEAAWLYQTGQMKRLNDGTQHFEGHFEWTGPDLCDVWEEHPPRPLPEVVRFFGDDH